MNIEISVRNERFEVLCSGDVSQAEVLMCIDKIGETKKAHPEIERCLVDCRATRFQIDTFGRFTIGEYAAKKLAGQRLWIAMAAPKDAITRVLENTAYNRGLPLFTTDRLEAAERWLAEVHPRSG